MYIAQVGNLDVLQWARRQGIEWDENACAQAAWKGHLHVLKWWGGTS
jgi:hypothetical protein